jgi:prolyl oligopeptidase
MKKNLTKSLIYILFIFLANKGFTQIIYPSARDCNIMDTIWGQAVKDPYRWMEDIRSPEVTEWLKGQEKIADKYSGRVNSMRGYLEIYSYLRFKPIHRQGQYYFS